MQDSNVPGAAASTAPVSETAPEAKTATADPRMEAFAVKERQLRKMQQELQVEKQRLSGESLKYQTDYVPKSRLTEDPMGVLYEHGITPEKISELLLNAPNNNDPTVRALRAEMKKIQDKQEATEKRLQDETGQRYQQAIKQIGNEVRMMVDSSPDYETIKSAGMQDAVVELIEQTFNRDGVLMSNEEAAQKVEEALIAEGMKFASISKIQAKLAPKADEGQKSPPGQQSVKTLTQSMTNSAPAGRSSESERVARAIAAFNGQRK